MRPRTASRPRLSFPRAGGGVTSRCLGNAWRPDRETLGHVLCGSAPGRPAPPPNRPAPPPNRPSRGHTAGAMFSGSRTSSPGSATASAACGPERPGEVATAEASDKELQDGMQEGKEQIRELNERFAKYINGTVLNLQRRNRELLAELRRRQRDEFGAAERAYQQEYQDFQGRVDDLQNELVLLRLERDKLRARLDKEGQLRRDLQHDSAELRKRCEEAAGALDGLQAHGRLAEAQLAQLRLVRDQERLYWQQKLEGLQGAESAAGGGGAPDLEQALRLLRHGHEQAWRRARDELRRYRQRWDEDSAPLQRLRHDAERCRRAAAELRLRDDLQRGHAQEKEREAGRVREHHKALERQLEARAADLHALLGVKSGLEQELAGYKSLLNQVERKARDYSAPPCLGAPPAKGGEESGKLWC
ncbi:glial fibrillary acidic protein-like [Narcine bancroftii]|uniref:glial fibrillary acidic protein-like n=1 Tax=Narcine bancroftii TaxID=1343680 RepID=UPI0038313CD2